MAGICVGRSGRTIQEYDTKGIKQGGIKIQQRGKHERDFLLDDEDVRMDVRQWTRRQKGEFTAITFRDWLMCGDKKDAEGFIPVFQRGEIEEAAGRLGMELPPCESTCCTWLHKLGCGYSDYKKSYYTDTHESEENRETRVKYSTSRIQSRSLRQPVWVHVPEKVFQKTYFLCKDPPKFKLSNLHQYTDPVHKTRMYEIHVDFMNNLDRTKYKYGGEWSVRFPIGQTKIYAIGQDEMVTHQNDYKTKTWTTGGEYNKETRKVEGGEMPMRKKNRGKGVHASCYVDCIRGLGFPLTEPEAVACSKYLKGKGLDALTNSADNRLLRLHPGLEFITIGGDSWWRYVDFEAQFVRVVSCFKVVYCGAGDLDKPQCEPACAMEVDGVKYEVPPEPSSEWELHLTVDHSQNHNKYRPGALNANQQNRGFGGKQVAMRDTEITTASQLGPHNPTLKVGSIIQYALFMCSYYLGW